VYCPFQVEPPTLGPLLAVPLPVQRLPKKGREFRGIMLNPGYFAQFGCITPFWRGTSQALRGPGGLKPLRFWDRKAIPGVGEPPWGFFRGRKRGGFLSTPLFLSLPGLTFQLGPLAVGLPTCSLKRGVSPNFKLPLAPG